MEVFTKRMRFNKKAMHGLKSIAVSLTLVGLFAFSMIMFGIQLANDNGATQSIADDPSVARLSNALYSNLTSYHAQANASSSAFSTDKPTVGALFTQMDSVAGIWKSITTIPYTVYQLTIGFIVTNIFGGSGGGFAIVATIIAALISVIIILYAWKWIRGGDPD